MLFMFEKVQHNIGRIIFKMFNYSLELKCQDCENIYITHVQLQPFPKALFIENNHNITSHISN